MKIVICGAGPAGLYFALLMKSSNPSHSITVIEQNPSDATYGWGVVFSSRALAFMEAADAASYADISKRLEKWSEQTIGLDDDAVRIDGFAFSGIARLELLQILQHHCRDRGVILRFNERITRTDELLDSDLVVGADGVNSVVRQVYADHFQPDEEVLKNYYVWYGTRKLFDTLSLTFRRHAGGFFVAHHYRYSPQGSTFIVECDRDTWHRMGFSGMTEDESRRFCEGVFAKELDGQPLLVNKSSWLNFKAVTNRRWKTGNVVLLGDALRTVHFSIGSGTRMAFVDAIALHRAFRAHQDVQQALESFETEHRPAVDEFLSLAKRSYRWYEEFPSHMGGSVLDLAHSYMVRSGLTESELKQRAPRFMALYEGRQYA